MTNAAQSMYDAALETGRTAAIADAPDGPVYGPAARPKRTARGPQRPLRPRCLILSAGSGHGRRTQKRRQPPTQPLITLAWTIAPGPPDLEATDPDPAAGWDDPLPGFPELEAGL